VASSPAVLTEIEQRISAELSERGCEIAAFKYCFHDEAEQCDCRKPKPGMLLEVARELESTSRARG
jgi:D-glycero-D-manno-heptose 1,7-bisphosphate phosphatase